MTGAAVLYLTEMKVMGLDLLSIPRSRLSPPPPRLNARSCALETLSCGFRLEICLVALRRTGSNTWEVNAGSFSTCHTIFVPLLENKLVDNRAVCQHEVWTWWEHLSSPSTLPRTKPRSCLASKSPTYTHTSGVMVLCLMRQSELVLKVSSRGAVLSVDTRSPLSFCPLEGHRILEGNAQHSPFICFPWS